MNSIFESTCAICEMGWTGKREVHFAYESQFRFNTNPNFNLQSLCFLRIHSTKNIPGSPGQVDLQWRIGWVYFLQSRFTILLRDLQSFQTGPGVRALLILAHLGHDGSVSGVCHSTD